MSGFRRIGEHVVHEGRVVTMAIGTFEGPDGTTFDRDIVHHPGAVSVVAVDDDGTVVLVRQYRAPVDAELLELPAGTLDIDGEPPLTCAQRELAEEVGLAADRWEALATVHHSPGFCDEVGRVFLAQGLRPVADARQGVEEQAMTVERWPLADALAMVESGTVRDAKTVIGLLLARERLLR